jgi:signal transduction histidine kinase
MIRDVEDRPVHHPSVFWTIPRKKPLLALTAASLLLVAYIVFLLISNVQSQLALRKASLNRFHLDLEKRAASLGYFFSERKYDLKGLAHSREINNYFFNKALGMSEQYGLMVNLFMIQQLLEKTLAARDIQGTKIYSRFALLDNVGKVLADTSAKAGGHLQVPKPDQGSPEIYFAYENNQTRLLLSTSCSYRGKIVGWLIVWLDEETLFSHFVNINDNTSLSGAGLVDDQGETLLSDPTSNGAPIHRLPPEMVNNLRDLVLSVDQYHSSGKTPEMLIACLPIPNIGLRYMAWMPTEQITGGFAPLLLIISMVALAVVVLASLGSILWISAQNLILKTRFDEAAKQQDILSSKNRQLKAEICKREQAESELATQRTLRIRSDRLRSLGEMAAGIAHELNQPLVGVRGFAELMIDSVDNDMPLSSGSIRQYAEKIVHQADRMVHIINHIRLFARDAGGIETTVVNLNEVVNSGLSLLRAQFDSHGLLLEHEFTPHPLWVKVNSFSVEEVILNLLSNSRHAVEQRKAEEDELYHPCIRVTTSKHFKNGSKGDAVLVIDDNGTGVAADVADRIFDPFFTTKAPDKGTGLGLSICKSIVESFEGTIEYISTADKLTRFKIKLPTCIEEG